MSKRIYTEEEIQDLTDRVFLLRQRLVEGKMFFAAHLVDDFRNSYEAIRLRPDGLVDPDSVDGRIRAATLAIQAMKYRDDVKKQVSLNKIQEVYFDYLFQQFGWLYDRMKKYDLMPYQVAESMIRDTDFVKKLVLALPDITNDLTGFWESVADAGVFHLQDGRQLKATFAGDLFPAFGENVASTAGLYVDTIILPCPAIRIAPLLNVMPDSQVAKYWVKHVLTAMTYRDLATADVNPPIVVIFPDQNDLENNGRHSLLEQAQEPTCKHGEYLFGRPFESVSHLEDFCRDLVSIDQVVAELKHADRLLFDTEWSSDPRAQLERVMVEQPQVIPGLEQKIAGHHVFSACLGRIPQALAAQTNALNFGATPLINAETSWKYYTWLLEYEAKPNLVASSAAEGMHVVRALVSETGNNLEWLGNVPTPTILEIRKRGYAEEIRQLLGRGIAELIEANPDNYFRTTDQVIDNLDSAFKQHQETLLDAKSKKLKLYGIDVATCLAVGGVSVAAAYMGNPAVGAVSGLLGMAGFPNLKDIKSKYSEIAKEEQLRKNSPTGLLFRHLK